MVRKPPFLVRYLPVLIFSCFVFSICCTLREDLLQEVARLAAEGIYDHLIIESTGVSEPLPVAETFTFKPDNSSDQCLFDVAEIDTMVTVVDAASFIREMAEAEDLQQRGLAVNEEDVRTITDLLVAQIEFADVIVINKIDRVSVRAFNKVNQIVRSLNAEAVVLSSINSKVNIEEIISAKRFNFERTSQSPTWLRAINSGEPKKYYFFHIMCEFMIINKNVLYFIRSESEEYGISSFVYRATRPFHPARLFAFVDERLNQRDESDAVFGIDYPRILRSKGFFWLASRPTDMLIWSQAGGLFQLSSGGTWLVDSSNALAAAAMEYGAEVSEDDRRQELVFIGTNVDENELTGALNDCLLTDAELTMGSERWLQELEDPFPQTSVDALDVDHDEESFVLL